MQSSTNHIKKYKKREKSKNIKRSTNYKERGAKEQRERITRCESPSPRPIKKGARKENMQLVIRSIQVRRLHSLQMYHIKHNGTKFQM